MTPRHFDPRVVQAKIASIDELLDDLQPYQQVTGQQLTEDRLTRHVVERILTLVVDSAVAANSHTVATLSGDVPVDYASTFEAMAHLGAISAELAARLAPSTGLRNVLVHEYVNVDRDIVAAAVAGALTDYGEYVTAVARWLTSREPT